MNNTEQLLKEAYRKGFLDGRVAEAKTCEEAVREAEIKLISQITTDKGDAYFQGVPLWRYQEQLRDMSYSRQSGKET